MRAFFGRPVAVCATQINIALPLGVSLEYKRHHCLPSQTPNLMSADQRKHTRFSLEIPAVIFTRYGDRQETVLQQISVGGCFTGWEENVYTGDEFRMEVQLPNGNRLPLACRAVYRFENTGVGVKFLDLTEFEQSLIAKIIREKLRAEGLPMHIDPLTQPTGSGVVHETGERVFDERREKDSMLEKIMSND